MARKSPPTQVVFCPADASIKEWGWRPIRCARHYPNDLSCTCQPGPQWRMLLMGDYEICTVGGRGSVKSEGGFGFLMRGNLPDHLCPKRDNEKHDRAHCKWCAADICYFNHPHYHALVLRKNMPDLQDWIKRGMVIYKHFGAELKSDPLRVVFPTGADITLGHMDTEDSYEKWWGQEFCRMVFEEIQQCAKRSLYENIKLSCRCPHDALHEQILLTANPGGVGNSWIRDYFLGKQKPDFVQQTKDRLSGKPCSIIRHRDQKSGRSRVFIHSTVYDNPIYCKYKDGKRDTESQDYCRGLEALRTDTERRQWLYGDLFCFEGAYYGELREQPASDEPPEAFHIVRRSDNGAYPVELAPYWTRAIGLDIGYVHNMAAVWGCWHPEGRLYIYRELSLNKTGIYETGVRIASLSLPDLEALPSAHITIYGAHDLFHRRDEYTMADQLKAGIDEVLGRNATFIVYPTDEEKGLPAPDMYAAIKRRQLEQAHRTNITILRASNDRVGGWSEIRNLLRWWKVHPDKQRVDEVYAKRLRLHKSIQAEMDYRRSVDEQKEEIVPKLRIFDCCPKLYKSLFSLVHDEPARPEDVKKQDGDDEADALRYLVNEFRPTDDDVPRDVWINQKAEEAFADKPGLSTFSKIQSMRYFEQEYERAHKGGRGFTIPRMAGRRGRLMRSKGEVSLYA